MRFFLEMRCVLLLTLTLGTAGCPSPGTDSADAGADSVTQRERYEAVGRSNLPGAQGVRGALDASDDIQSREARQDSILQGQ